MTFLQIGLAVVQVAFAIFLWHQFAVVSRHREQIVANVRDFARRVSELAEAKIEDTHLAPIWSAIGDLDRRISGLEDTKPSPGDQGGVRR